MAVIGWVWSTDGTEQYDVTSQSDPLQYDWQTSESWDEWFKQASSARDEFVGEDE